MLKSIYWMKQMKINNINKKVNKKKRRKNDDKINRS